MKRFPWLLINILFTVKAEVLNKVHIMVLLPFTKLEKKYTLQK